MRILLLGATGRTGKWVLKTALEKGHSVHCLSRNSHRIPKKDGIAVFEGNPASSDDLKKAMEGCEAIISVLNISRTSDFPWARLRTPKTLLSDTMSLVVSSAKELGIKRAAICSAWGVAETKKDIPNWFKWFIDNSNIGVAYTDHERQENILQQSHLDWSIARPVGLSNSKRTETIQESLNNKPKPSMLISRKSVGRYLVESLENETLIGKKVVISKK